MPKNNDKQKLPQQEAYAEKNENLADFRKQLNAIVKKAAQDLAAENPEFQDFDVLPQNIAYIKNKEGTIRAIYKIAEHMMWPSSMDKTQDEIREGAQKHFPDLPLKKGLWNKELKGRVRKKVEETVKCNMQKPPSFKGCKTLAQFRKKVRAANEIALGARTFKTSITFSRDAVVFGHKSYNLTLDKVAGQTYPRIRVMHEGKRCPLRMDLLVAILKEAEGK